LTKTARELSSLDYDLSPASMAPFPYKNILFFPVFKNKTNQSTTKPSFFMAQLAP
jgi:hypothetical protein